MSPQNITFLYPESFRIKYAESYYKNVNKPPFCSLQQSSFSASEAQLFNLSDYCYESCLIEYFNKNVYVVNQESQFLVFRMIQRGINAELNIPNFDLSLESKILLKEEFHLDKLKNAKLLINEQLGVYPAAILLILDEKYLYYYYDGSISKVDFDFSKFENKQIYSSVLFGQYLLIPDDSTGVKIFICLKDPLSKVATLTPFFTIAIQQFYGDQEWKDIQDKLSKSQEGKIDFNFNFAIQSFQVWKQSLSSSYIFAYEQYSQSICVFLISFTSSEAKLISKISINGKVSSVVAYDNFLYVHSISEKGLKEQSYLVELQNQSMHQDYLPRQTYPLTSTIQKVVVSNKLSYSLQENIVSIIRRQIPFKLSSEDEAKSQISIIYSEGADNLWHFNMDINFNQINDSSQEDTTTNTNLGSNNYFSKYITLTESSNNISIVDAILIKKDQSLSLKVISERMPYLNCLPEEKEVLSTKYLAYLNIEVYESIDKEGNIQLSTYLEGIQIAVYKEIFENSTIALVVGLSVGLTLTLIVVIIFCIYFYRMKNHYQLLLDYSQKESSDVFGYSVSSSSSENNSSSDSYPTSFPTTQQISNTIPTQQILTQPKSILPPNLLQQNNFPFNDNGSNLHQNNSVLSLKQLRQQQQNALIAIDMKNQVTKPANNVIQFTAQEQAILSFKNDSPSQQSNHPTKKSEELNNRRQHFVSPESFLILSIESDIPNNTRVEQEEKKKQINQNDIHRNEENKEEEQQQDEDEIIDKSNDNSDQISLHNNSLEEIENQHSNSDKSSKGQCAAPSSNSYKESTSDHHKTISPISQLVLGEDEKCNKLNPNMNNNNNNNKNNKD